jgi:hypothetical protein
MLPFASFSANNSEPKKGNVTRLRANGSANVLWVKLFVLRSEADMIFKVITKYIITLAIF